MSPTAPEMVAEAVEISKIAPNVVVKIPMGVEGLKAVGVLEREKDVRVNLTMTFSAAQAFLAMKAGASFVSVVLSRLDAIGGDSAAFVADAVAIKRNYGFSSELIAGSVKTQAHVLACLRAGVDVATLPEALFFQLFEHPLTDAALEQFARDWRNVPR
jgi:transaldolase